MIALFFATLALADPSTEAFHAAARVFQHPRCLNCHPVGDHPTQGNDLHAHAMLVQRGETNHGFITLQCAACHTQANYLNVPGAPKWGLAPKEMGWQGLSERELCLALKDLKKTHMTPAQLAEHTAHDPLVGWAWNPGLGREPAPGTQEEFGRLVKEWLDTGAHCPD
jgi:hypothetical protein